MAKRNLTDRALKALKSDAMDTVVPGFGVRVLPLGAKTFVLIARYPGSTNPTRRAIGRYGAIDLATARQTARDWLEMIRQGKDPAEEIERQRTTEARQRANTFGAVFEDFAREKLHTERKGAEVERDLRKECLPEWGAGR
jgi:hypothetical protein